MAANVVESSVEGEGQFAFNKWVQEHELGEIKDLLIKHEMTTRRALTTTSDQFTNLFRDPQLLAKAHFIPRILDALNSLQQIAQQNNTSSTIKTVVISEKENEAINGIKSNLKILHSLEIEINDIKQKYPNSISKLNALKNDKIENSKQKVIEVFEVIEQMLKTKRIDIINKLNALKSSDDDIKNNDDEKEMDIISKSADLLQIERNHLNEQLKICTDLIQKSNDNDSPNNARKDKIINIGNKTSEKFNNTKNKLNDDVNNFKNMVNKNNSSIPEINFIVNENKYNNIIDGIQNIGDITNKMNQRPNNKQNVPKHQPLQKLSSTSPKDSVKSNKKTKSKVTSSLNMIPQQEQKYNESLSVRQNSNDFIENKPDYHKISNHFIQITKVTDKSFTVYNNKEEFVLKYCEFPTTDVKDSVFVQLKDPNARSFCTDNQKGPKYSPNSKKITSSGETSINFRNNQYENCSIKVADDNENDGYGVKSNEIRLKKYSRNEYPPNMQSNYKPNKVDRSRITKRIDAENQKIYLYWNIPTLSFGKIKYKITYNGDNDKKQNNDDLKDDIIELLPHSISLALLPITIQIITISEFGQRQYFSDPLQVHITSHSLYQHGTILPKPGTQGSCNEIVTIAVGRCGIQIGNLFWNTILKEHNVNLQGKLANNDPVRTEKLEVYFEEVGANKYTPRAVFIDLEPGALDLIQSSSIGNVYKVDNYCWGASGAGNNWGKGHYMEGAELIDEAVDIVRREAESCDCLGGFQLTHSIGGGTGSGMGTLLMLKIRDNYPDKLTASFSVFPSVKVSDVVVEPYNATLSIHQMLENADLVFIMDNEALLDISQNTLKQKEPKYADLNWLISLAMSDTTASLRFGGYLNNNYRKMATNLTIFPRLHFFAVSEAPLFCKSTNIKENTNIEQLTHQIWSSSHCYSKLNFQDGKYLTSSCIYRGSNLLPQLIDEQVSKTKLKSNNISAVWVPDQIKSTIIRVPSSHSNVSAVQISNTTAIKNVFLRISRQFAKMYKRKAFLHWYKGEGMDEMEFQEADKNVRDVITEYQDKQDAVVDLDDDDEDSDEDDDSEEEEDEDWDEDEDEDF